VFKEEVRHFTAENLFACGGAASTCARCLAKNFCKRRKRKRRSTRREAALEWAPRIWTRFRRWQRSEM